ncbi:MAG: hypothetical protein H7289_12430 [Mucilaginibacter sp.]|nr:hypothetical protein [Mucilaginibacter sp.]
MGETFTLNVLTNQNEVKKENLKENLEGDDLMFYHSLRPNLVNLEKKPKLQTIHNILDYSKSLR